MKQVVINNCFGGFGLSPKAVKKYAELSGINVFAYTDDRNTENKSRLYNRIDTEFKEDDYFLIYWLKNDLGPRINSDTLNKDGDWLHERDIKRDDPNLVKVVQLMGKEANTRFSALKIVEVPDDVEYEICDYDGNEHIAETHRTWS